MRFLSLIAAGGLALGQPQAWAQYELSETLSAPYVQSIHASHDDQALAWVVDEAGRRNLWYTPSDSLAPRALTDYQSDDGLDIGGVQLTDDCLFFVRGNGSNRYGEPANPASLPQTPRRQLLRLRLRDAQLDTIASAADPVLSPDGQQLLYTQGNRVFLLDDVADSSPVAQPLFAVRQSVGGLSWSPDGQQIAFVSERGDHSFVGVYTLAAASIRWIAPSLSFDQHPTWSPDGQRLAFVRRPGQGKDELYNLMGGVPFSLVVAEVASGRAEVIWRSPSDDGGFAQYYPQVPLRWARPDQLVFHSEHEGWHHVYAIQPDGRQLRDLTPGDCEVENSDLSRGARYLYVTTNCGDIDRRHIERIDLVSGAREAITSGPGIETHPQVLTDGAVAYRASRYQRPTGVVVQRGEERTFLPPELIDFPADQLLRPQAVTFEAADGTTIHGQLFLPPGDKAEAAAPAVIFMHGGPIRQMLLGYHYRHYYANAYTFNQYLASRGYVVLSVNYRAGIGYGRDFRRADDQGPRGAAEYQDILAAGRYLQDRPEVDPQRIGLWGGSYGGYLTAMGLAKNSNLFRAGVDLHGVHDWAWRARDFSPGGGWGVGPALMDQAYHASPLSELRFWSSPVLIVHGDDDRNVLFGQSIELKNRLDELGVHSEVLVFPDEVHGFLRYDSWRRTYLAAADFFDRFLKP